MTGFVASPAQRAKVALAPWCAVCGSAGSLDPAHVVARSLGGCDDPSCVIPLCRRCHDAYDEGRLDLLPFLERDGEFRAEQAHAVFHVGIARALKITTSGASPADRARDALGLPPSEGNA